MTKNNLKKLTVVALSAALVVSAWSFTPERVAAATNSVHCVNCGRSQLTETGLGTVYSAEYVNPNEHLIDVDVYYTCKVCGVDFVNREYRGEGHSYQIIEGNILKCFDCGDEYPWAR